MLGLICKVTGHICAGCACRRCGALNQKAPADDHDWDVCRCPKFGALNQKAPADDHDWDVCRCRKCGALNQKAPADDHDWDVCRCRKCGAVRHEWNDHGVCSRCDIGPCPACNGEGNVVTDMDLSCN